MPDPEIDPVFPEIPGFDCEAVLGRGGMAVVYAARDRALGRRVAIKVVSADGAEGARHVRRLEQEARGLAALQHPHIVELHTFGRTDDGSLYYVMPLLPGGDLTRWPKPLAAERLVALLDALLGALAHAHGAGIVHRDIKPENILFDAYERPLLADFGAAFVRGASRLTEHGMTIGSSYYMSPEQSRGLEVDARSDLYSLGVVAFEYLTGRLPFEGDDDLSIALAKLEQAVPRLSQPLAHWQPFFDRALGAAPESRFADADAMRRAMHDASRALPTSATEHASPAARAEPAPHRESPRRRGTLALVALGFVAAFAAMLLLLRDEPVSAEAIEAALAAGRLAPPDEEPNAVGLLARAASDGNDADVFAALETRTLAALAERVRSHLRDPIENHAVDAVAAWSQAIERLEARDAPPSQALARELSNRIGESFDAAFARHDPSLASVALRVLEAWRGAPASLQERARRVAALESIGDRIEDADAPTLVFVATGTDETPAFAVMAQPVDPALYGRFLADQGAGAFECPEAPRGVQGCLGIDDAEALASWLSEKTGDRYRVPERSELERAKRFVTPTAVRAWTSTCDERRTVQPQNVARRTWSGVRQVFGRSRLPSRVSVRCVGNYTVALDDRAEGRQVATQPAADSGVVLIREMRENGDGPH